MRYYFAYGSNMCAAQMAFRCPGARVVGQAHLDGWRFHANTRGSAAIRPNEDSVVHGVLWRCNAVHFHMLDRHEGVSWGNYLRQHVSIEMPCGARAPAITYVGTRTYDGLARVRYMMTAVLPGAEAFGLPSSYIEELRSWLPKGVIGEKRVPVRRGARPIRFLR